jgi:hypothetical protein
MTVQELIDGLMKIEDKSKKVLIWSKYSDEQEEIEVIEESLMYDRVYLEG